MHSLGDIAKSLNRSPVHLHALQGRFELPVFKGAGYSDAYLAFLRTVVFLRMLNEPEKSLREYGISKRGCYNYCTSILPAHPLGFSMPVVGHLIGDAAFS